MKPIYTLVLLFVSMTRLDAQMIQGPSSICAGDDPNYTIEPPPPPESYVWIYGDNLTTCNEITGYIFTIDTDDEYVFETEEGDGDQTFCIAVFSIPGDSIIDALLVTILPLPNVTLQVDGEPENDDLIQVCDGQSVEIEWVFDNGEAPYSFQYTVNGAPFQVNNHPNSTFEIPNLIDGAEYAVTSLEDDNGCFGINLSGGDFIYEEVSLSINNQPDNTWICEGNTATLIVGIQNPGALSITYQWQRLNGASWVDVSSQTNSGSSSTYTTSALFSNAQYRVIISDSGMVCDPDTSNVALVTVEDLPIADIDQSTPEMICIGGASAIPSGTASAAFGTFVWSFTGPISISNSSSLMPGFTGIGVGTAYLILTVTSNNSCSPAIDIDTFTIVVTGNPSLTITNPDPYPEICAGDPHMVIISTISAMNYDEGSISWQISPPQSGTFSASSNTLSPTFQSMQNFSGLVSLTLTLAGETGCEEETATATYFLNVSPRPAVNIMQSQGIPRICAGTEPHVIVTSGITGTYDANNVQWTIQQGSGSIVNPNQLNASYQSNPTENGMVQLRLTVHGIGNCSGLTATANYNITVDPRPAVALQFESGVICAGDVYDFSLENTVTAMHHDMVTWTGGNGALNNVNILDPVYTSQTDDGGAVPLQITVSGINACNNVDVVKNFSLQVNPLPVLQNFSLNRMGICDHGPNSEAELTISANIPQGTAYYRIGGGSTQFTQLGTIAIDPTSTGSLAIVLDSIKNIETGCVLKSGESKELRVWRNPIAKYDTMGFQDVAGIFISKSDPGESQITSYYWMFENADIGTSTEPTIHVTFESPGIKKVVHAVQDLNMCSDTIVGEIAISSDNSCEVGIPEVVGSQQFVCTGQEVDFRVNVKAANGGDNVIDEVIWRVELINNMGGQEFLHVITCPEPIDAQSSTSLLFSDMRCNNNKLRPMASGTLFVSVSIKDEFPGGLCIEQSLTSYEIEVKQTPNYELYPDKSEYCEGDVINIDLRSDYHSAELAYSLTVANNNATLSNQTITVPPSGETPLISFPHGSLNLPNVSMPTDVTISMSSLQAVGGCSTGFGVVNTPATFRLNPTPEIKIKNEMGTEQSSQIQIIQGNSLTLVAEALGVDSGSGSWICNNGQPQSSSGNMIVVNGACLCTYEYSTNEGCPNEKSISISTETLVTADISSDCSKGVLYVKNAGAFEAFEWTGIPAYPDIPKTLPYFFPAPISQEVTVKAIINQAASVSDTKTIPFTPSPFSSDTCTIDQAIIEGNGNSGVILKCENQSLCHQWYRIPKNPGEFDALQHPELMSEDFFYFVGPTLESNKYYYYLQTWPKNDSDCEQECGGVTIHLRSPIDMDPPDLTRSALIIPNPNNGNFNLEYRSPDPGLHVVEIFDPLGRKVSERRVIKVETELHESFDMTGSGGGLYYLRIYPSRGNIQTLAFVVQH